jgi:hypothetical protein
MLACSPICASLSITNIRSTTSISWGREEHKWATDETNWWRVRGYVEGEVQASDYVT